MSSGLIVALALASWRWSGSARAGLLSELLEPAHLAALRPGSPQSRPSISRSARSSPLSNG